MIAPDDLQRFLSRPDVDELDVGRPYERMDFLTQGISGGHEQELLGTALHGMLDDAEELPERIGARRSIAGRFLGAAHGSQHKTTAIVLVPRYDVYRDVAGH